MGRFLFRLLATMSVVCLQGWCGDKPPNYALYVASSRGDDITIIDLSSLKAVGDIKLGERIHGLALQPDGKKIFATVESDKTLRVIDAVTRTQLGSVKVSGRPNQCAVTPNGRYVVVPIRDGDQVQIVDVARLKVIKSLPLKEPHNAVNTGSNRYTFVSSMASHTVNVIDLETMDYSAVIPVGARPRPYVVSNDGHVMYVALADLHGFVVVDVDAKKVIDRVEMPAEHPTPHPLLSESADTRTHGLALTPDGRELWVSSLLDDCMYIYDVQSKKIVGKVMTGSGPNWIVFTPDGKYACISNSDSDDVSIIDVKSRAERARVKVSKAPKRLALGILLSEIAK